MSDQPSPLELIRAEHRHILDRQARLSTEARALGDRVRTVTAELAALQRHAELYTAVLRILDTASRTTTQTTPTTPRRRTK